MAPSRKRLLGYLAVAIAAAYLATCAFFYSVFVRGPDAIVAVMNNAPMAVFMVLPFRALWNHARGGDLEKGDVAPEFTLPRQDGAGSVSLAEFRERKPVALIFGSYT
ncbi:MAG: hypothetical protein L0Z55_06395 [Planctomycetes bacterium]|nr:hypothetical protein [Planctomycetota bacterium]